LENWSPTFSPSLVPIQPKFLEEVQVTATFGIGLLVELLLTPLAARLRALLWESQDADHGVLTIWTTEGNAILRGVEHSDS
jgi:hypothetical protein